MNKIYSLFKQTVRSATPLSICLVLLVLCKPALSQQDTEFWFAAPEIAQNDPYPDGYSPYDRPALLRISNMGTQTANVTMTIPAAGITIGNISVAPGTVSTFDLTSQIDNLETKPDNTIHNKGIRIN